MSPRRPPSVCAQPGCPQLASGTRCLDHEREYRRAKDQRRGPQRSNYGDRRWRAVRKAYLAAHPTCECSVTCIEPATDVDHRDGLGLQGTLAYEWSNLRAMSHGHHSQHTARTSPGGWNRR